MKFIENKEISVARGLARTAKLRAEYFECIEDPAAFLAAAKAERLKADLFTFVQDLQDRNPRYPYHMEWDTLAVVPITTYDEWWKKQINGKTRNMIRKAEKSGVEIRPATFDDALVHGIQQIYNESPLRQGKPFLHYGKDFETLRKAHITYLDRSEFIGAYLEGSLIGFVKLFHRNGISSLMQVISKVSCRDKAPTNALIAKAIEICAARRVHGLHYGIWSRRTLGEFKKHHGFEPYTIPRYFVPLTAAGRLVLGARLHRGILERLPADWQDYLVDLRTKGYAWKYRAHSS